MPSILTNLDPRGILTVTLNRPAVHNAFDDRLIVSLTAELARAERDEQVRLVLLTGAASSFSAGADLNWMQRMADASAEENEHDALALAGLMRTLNYLNRPTIARVNGHAFGGGVGLLACCDIVIAAEHARFGVTEARLGLAPAVIAPYLYRCMGERQARRCFLTGERFDAERALALGLVHEVVPEKALDDTVERAIGGILAGGPLAVRECKRLAFLVAGHDADEQLKLDQETARLIARLRISQEGQEGLRAFLEKREAAWASTVK